MLEKLEVVSQMFHGFAYEEYFGADTGKKLSLMTRWQRKNTSWAWKMGKIDTSMK